MSVGGFRRYACAGFGTALRMGRDGDFVLYVFWVIRFDAMYVSMYVRVNIHVVSGEYT